MTKQLFNKRENKRHPHLTAEQHLMLGELLQDVHDWAVPLSVLLSNTYGKNSRIKTSAMNVVEALKDLKIDLDALVCTQFEDVNGVDSKTVYLANRRVSGQRIDKDDNVWSARTMYARKNESKS